MKQCSTKSSSFALNSFNVSLSKHLRGEKKGAWMYPPTWKLDFTRPLIRIDYTLPTQPPQAALSKLSKHFSLFKQISKKCFK